MPPTCQRPTAAISTARRKTSTAPGILNPAVTQSTIKQTICKSGWTSMIRQPTSYTNPIKLQELKAYGYGGRSPSGFELDHLISRELGGAPSDECNLWPENQKNSFDKDGLENSLKSQVCSRSITLAKAQWRIVHWPRFVRQGQQVAPEKRRHSERVLERWDAVRLARPR